MLFSITNLRSASMLRVNLYNMKITINYKKQEKLIEDKLEPTLQENKEKS